MDLVKAIFGIDKKVSQSKFECIPAPMGCGEKVDGFRDDVSQREYQISGLCQKCQDTVFNSDATGYCD